MKKQLSLLLLFCLLATGLQAQTAASYAFSTLTTPTYAAISGTAAGGVTTGDDVTQTGISIGFNFVFCGTTYNTVSACSNGWLSLSNSGSTQWTNTAANVPGTGFLMPFWDDLNGSGGTSTARYTTTGSSPNRVFTFEWSAWQENGLVLGFLPTILNNVSMQVKLYETTNVIDFCYGPSPSLGTAGFLTSVSTGGTIGIANSTTDYQTLNAASASPTASSATFTTSIGNAPPANRIYRWTPNCTLTASAATSGTICSGNTLNLTGTILTGTATTFSWAGPAGYSSALQSPSIPNAPISRTGTYTFTATSTSCSYSATATATVDTTPVAAISGTTGICNGNSSTITFTGTAGATVSYNINGGPTLNVVLNAAGTASVNTGVLTTGASPTTYTYALSGATLGSCTRPLSATVVVTVNPLPAAISGVAAICEGGFTTSLSCATGTGTWSSSASTIASVNTTTGLVTSGVSGTANIFYTLPVTGCSSSLTVTVNPTPPAITGSLQVCQSGGTTNLSNLIPSGTWSASPSGIAVINASTGVATGVVPGSATVTYTVGTSCFTTATLTVNPTLTPIVGPGVVCQNSTITLSHPVTGGTWSASPATIATIDAVTGEVHPVAPGTVTITYLAPTNCATSRNITVNAIPAAITGIADVCLNSTTALANATPAGTWSSANNTIASIGSSSGIVTGMSTGTTTLSYTVAATGCYVTVPSTVNPLPAMITGPTTTVCGGGGVITLSNTTPLGTWSSGATATASADAATGAITGGTAGTAPISYTISATGCYVTTNVTVLPTPLPISGAAGVCEAGSTIALTDGTTPGTWSISPAGIASISMGGVVTGGTAGTATVTYTGSNSCYVTHTVTVNPLPAAITGTLSVCQMAVTHLASTSTGGTWTTGAPFIATVGSTGDVYGVLGGTAPITYTLPTGCLATATVTVNAIPGAITGNNYVCHGYTTAMSNSVAGGVWSISPLTNATVDASGTVYGVAVGAATVTYTTGTNGCFTTKAINVNPIVAAGLSVGVSPSTTVCAGTTVTFTSVPVNGGSAPIIVWSVNGVILSGAATYSYVPADGDVIRCWFISSYDCAIPDTASDVVTMTVHPIVTPGLSLTTGTGDTVCTGALTTVMAVPVNGGTAPTYQWSVNLIPVGIGPAYPFIANNGDMVTCTMTSNAFCQTAATATATKILTVSPYLTPLVAMNSSLGLTTCEGYPNTYTASQINGGTAPAYHWFVNGTGVGTGPVYTYAPVNADDVAVTLTSNFPCLATPTATTNMVMTVLPITQPVGLVTAVPGYIIAPGMYDTFTCTIVSGGGVAPTYQWYKSGFPVAGATTNVYITNMLSTGDSVTCQVTNTDQCSGVSVFNYVNITVGNVGVQHVAGNTTNLQLVPNPNNGSFVIRGTLADKYTEDMILEVTDMLGRTVHQSTTRAMNGNIDHQVTMGNNLANGMYMLSVQSKHVSSVVRFVIEK